MVTVMGSQGALLGPDSPTFTMQYIHTLYTWNVLFKHCVQQRYRSTFGNFDKSMSKQVITIWSRHCRDLTLTWRENGATLYAPWRMRIG